MMNAIKAENVYEASVYTGKGYIPVAGRTYIDALRSAGKDLPAGNGYIDISEIQGIRGIEQYDNCVCIGAAATLSYISDYLLYDFTGEFNALCLAAMAVGNESVRKRATIGGSIAVCSPASDIVPALLALNAKIELMGPDGIRITDISGFLRDGRPALSGGGIITGVILYRRGGRSTYEKEGERGAFERAKAGAAVWLNVKDVFIENAALAASSATPSVIRLERAENALKGRKTGNEVFLNAAAIAAEEAKEDADKEALIRVLVSCLKRAAD